MSQKSDTGSCSAVWHSKLMKRTKAKGGSKKRVKPEKKEEEEEGLDTFRRILAERPAIRKGANKRPVWANFFSLSQKN